MSKLKPGSGCSRTGRFPLTPRQRSAFILCDGKRTVEQVLEAGMGVARGEYRAGWSSSDLLGSIDGSAPVASAAPANLNGSLAVPVAAAATAPAAQAAPAPSAAPALAPATTRPAAPASGAGAAPAATEPLGPATLQGRVPDRHQLSGGLGLRGFRLNLAVEGTSSYEQLLELLPKIQAAVGVEESAPARAGARGG